MSNKNKLQKFAEMATFTNVVQAPPFSELYGSEHPMRGKWSKQFFGNDHPLVLELGCGKGEYSVGLARRFPEKNFLGVDIKGARIWKGASEALQSGLPNVGFLRTRIELIGSFFAPGEVSEIWITFPDPQARRNRAKKRLTSAGFLTRYRTFLKPDGVVHLKTDSRQLYDFTLSVIELNRLECLDATHDLYGSGRADDILSIRTHYETLFMGKGFAITYLQFRLTGSEPLFDPDPDSCPGLEAESTVVSRFKNP